MPAADLSAVSGAAVASGAMGSASAPYAPTASSSAAFKFVTDPKGGVGREVNGK